VGNAIHIGTGSVISKDLKESGMYVGQALRFIDNNLDLIKSKLNKVEEDGLVEIVYTKK
jgi:serine acetyltransferase